MIGSFAIYPELLEENPATAQGPSDPSYQFVIPSANQQESQSQPDSSTPRIHFEITPVPEAPFSQSSQVREEQKNTNFDLKIIILFLN